MAMNYFAIPGIRRDANTIDQIIGYVNAHFQIECRDRTRKRPYSEARAIVMKLARQNPVYTLSSIGDAFGQDHTTVMHAISTLDNRLEVNDWIADHYWDICDKMNTGVNG